MRGSRNVCLESGLLSALQRFHHWNGVSLAGRLWPNIKRWLRSFASFSWFWTSIAKEPYSIVISHGSAPPPPLWKRAWMISNPENFTLIDDISSMWHSGTNISHVSNIYGSRGGEWGSWHPTYTDKPTHTRARVLADHRDVCLLMNTGLDPPPSPPTPPPPPRQFKKLYNQHSSVRQRNTWSPPIEATIWICVCNYFNLTVCKWMLVF